MLQQAVLTGPGGVGKTRLAIEVAERVAGDFPDGTVFVDLTPLRDPGLVLGAVARQLGVDERDATPLASLLAMALRERRMLLVLDNFEQVLATRDAVLELLPACPGVVILVTSRVALRVRAGREYPVAPLALPGTLGPAGAEGAPAVQLFLDRADAAGVALAPDAATAEAVAGICRRLDGIPLAAARLPLLPPGHLLTRWAAGCRSWWTARMTCRTGRRPCATRSPGATSCWTGPSSGCSASCACSPAAAPSTRSRRPAGPTP